MADILERTETGREIARKSHEEGMRVLLHAKFGDIADLDDLAKRLTAEDFAGNITRIATGATLDDLR